MGDMAIELSGLGKVYGRGKNAFTAVRPTTLSVPWGQVIGLLGPNGAGKTTIIKMICGLITPTSGTVRLGGYDMARRRSKAVRRIGAVLEGSRNVYWPMSAWENLMYFGRLKGLRGSEIKPRARRLLTELDLWERRHQPVGSYSRGMQQKVAIAAALITDPPILLLDEPTIGLDVEAARTVKDRVARLVRDEGKTVVLTTHQLETAQELADRVAVIKDGGIVADLPTPDLLARFREDRFTVEISGTPDGLADALPANVDIEAHEDATRITVADTGDELYGLLAEIRARRTNLLSVTRVQPDLEEVFIRLVNDDAPAAEADGRTRNSKEPAA